MERSSKLYISMCPLCHNSVCLDGEELQVIHVSIVTVGFAWMEESRRLYMCLRCDTVGFASMQKSCKLNSARLRLYYNYRV